MADTEALSGSCPHPRLHPAQATGNPSRHHPPKDWIMPAPKGPDPASLCDRWKGDALCRAPCGTSQATAATASQLTSLCTWSCFPLSLTGVLSGRDSDMETVCEVCFLGKQI